MQSFLLIYVLIAAGVEKLELLSAQINLWNTSRAIAAGTALGPLSCFGAVLAITTHALIFLCAEVVLLILSMIIISSAYARVCSTLFALAYLVSSRTPAQGATT
jgi:hypothetical protein